jgi:glycosyltransferase 2 family protein
MVSRAPALERSGARAWVRLSTAIFKTVIGVGLLGALFLFGRIDLNALSTLIDAPAAIAICAAMVFLSTILAALRWGILLRALGLCIPFSSLFHFVAIALLANLFLLGPTGGDAVRGVYAWRAIGGASGRIAASVLADRLVSLLGLLFVSLVFSLFNWDRMWQVPALAALGTSLFLAFAVGIVATFALFVVPLYVRRFEERLSRWRLLAEFVTRVHELMLLFRSSPLRLLGAFALAVAIQLLTAAALVTIAETLKIGDLGAVDFLFAVPLTLLVNALPLTPNGIGIGEVAFDQICRWLEPVPSGASYSSIFFAFRAVTMLACLSGVVSYLSYRPGPIEDVSR